MTKVKILTEQEWIAKVKAEKLEQSKAKKEKQIKEQQQINK